MCGCVPVRNLQDISIQRNTIPPSCQRKALSLCAVTSLVLLVGLLIVIRLALNQQDAVGKNSTQDSTYDPSENVYDDCKSKAAVVADTAMTQKWDTGINLRRAQSDAEQNAREPAHIYMEKYHSVAIYLYTDIVLAPQDSKAVAQTGKQPGENKSAEYRSLYVSLGEAIQSLKHSQVTCLHTNYRTDAPLNLNVSNEQIHFSSFILASGERNFTSSSCFELCTCFGADVTYYSALKQKNQVLIPPYEVFKVTHIETNTERCQVVYRLKSNLNCVYDIETNTLHPICAFPLDIFWLIFIIISTVIITILLLFAIVKVLENHRKTAVYSVSSLHNSDYSPATVVF